MAVYSYIRKGTPDPVVRQLKLVQHIHCDGIYVEEADFRVDLELRRLIDALVVGEDTFVVANLKVLGKNTRQLTTLFQELQEKQVHFISIEEEIDTRKTLLSIYELMAILQEVDTFYYTFIASEKSKTTGEEVEGVRCGRPKVSEAKVDQIVYLRKEKGYPMRQISRVCDVSVGTVYKYLKAHHIV